MASGRLRYLEGFVVHDSEKSGAFYAWCKEIDKDVVIDYREWSGDTTLLGKWVEFTTNDGFHARDVRVLEDRFESRVRRTSGPSIGEIRVDVFYDGRHNQIDMFHHNYIGYVCDPRNIIRNVDRDRRYSVWVEKNSDRTINSQWKVSELAENYSGPSHNNTTRGSMCSGIIHNYNTTGDKFIAWSPSYPRSTITIDFSYCPRGSDMIGRWVDITIDEKKRVVDDVLIKPDMFLTRVRGSVLEINCKFESVPSREGDRCEMFYNDYFGNICDAKEVMRRPERGEWYRGWIVYHRQDGVDARWRLATRQDVEGPLNDSRPDSMSSRYYNDRPHSRQRYDSRNSDRYSPIQRNRSRSPVRRAQSPVSDYSRRPYSSRSPVRSLPDNKRPPSRHNDSRRRKDSNVSSAPSRAPTSDSEEEEWDQVGSSDEDNRPKQNNSSHQPAKPSSIKSSANTTGSRSEIVPKKTAPTAWNPHAHVHTRQTSSTTAPPSSNSKKAPEEDKSFRKLQTWASQLADYFEKFATNEKVRDEMVVYDYGMYEEGLDHVKKIRTLIAEISK